MREGRKSQPGQRLLTANEKVWRVGRTRNLVICSGYKAIYSFPKSSKEVIISVLGAWNSPNTLPTTVQSGFTYYNDISKRAIFLATCKFRDTIMIKHAAH